MGNKYTKGPPLKPTSVHTGVSGTKNANNRPETQLKLREKHALNNKRVKQQKI